MGNGQSGKPYKKSYVKPRYRKQGFQAINAILPDVTKKVFERYGFSTISLVTEWDMIVDPETASYTWPEKVSWPRMSYDRDGNRATQKSGHKGHYGATLFLGVAAHRALDVEYRTAEILERINQFFGYRAITVLRVVQVSPERHKATAEPGKVPAPGHTVSEDMLEGIEDEGLLQALRKLGENRR